MLGDSYVGIPYKLHTNTRENCDCYGLVQLIYKEELGIDLPSYGAEYNNSSTKQEIAELFDKHANEWTKVDNPQQGDLIYFQLNGYPKHVGVVLTKNLFIHNFTEGTSVTIASYTGNKWKNRVVGFYRYDNSTV